MKNKVLKIMIYVSIISLIFTGCTAENTENSMKKDTAEPSSAASYEASATITPTVTTSAVRDDEEKESEKTESAAMKTNKEMGETEENKPTQNAKPSEDVNDSERNNSSSTQATVEPVSVPTPQPTAVPTPKPTPAPTDPPKPDKGYRSSLGSSYRQSVLEAINSLKSSQGYPTANWSSGLASGAQNWADSLIDQSISKNKYTHYHDDNRDSSESIIWISKGTSASEAANTIASHSPKCISNATEIGIGAAVWMDCPIGDNLGFLVIRYYS